MNKGKRAQLKRRKVRQAELASVQRFADNLGVTVDTLKALTTQMQRMHAHLSFSFVKQHMDAPSRIN